LLREGVALEVRRAAGRVIRVSVGIERASVMPVDRGRGGCIAPEVRRAAGLV